MMASRLRAGIVIALIILCSALAGAAIERVAFRGNRRPAFGPGGPGIPSGGGPGRGPRDQDVRRRGEMLDQLTKELTLSTSQRSGIDTVMQRTDSSLRAIRTEMQPRLTKVFETARVDILARLDSTQRTKFEKMVPPGRGLPDARGRARR